MESNQFYQRAKKNLSIFKTERAEKLTDPKEISDAFNNYIIGPKLASKIQHTGKNYFDYLNLPDT